MPHSHPLLVPSLALAAALWAVAGAPPPAEALPVPLQARIAPSASWQPPTDLANAVARLALARERLARTGTVTLRYGEAQLRQLVATNTVPNPRFLVRVIASDPAPDAALGTPREGGRVPLWMTTFEQLEPADSDPEVLARLLGLRYDPQANYTLLVIEDFGLDAGKRPPLICPTLAALSELAARDLANAHFDPAVLREAMDRAYQPTYKIMMEAFYRRGFKEQLQDDVETFIADDPVLHDPAAARRFRARLRIHAQFGASHLFRGDGVTQLEGTPGRQAGVQELFVLDPAPTPIGAYERAGKLVRVPCRPLGLPRPAAFLDPAP